MEEYIELKVVEAEIKDVGRGIARIDPKDMKIIEIEVGDLVEIKGERATVAKVIPAFPESRGKRTIHIDGYTRENAQRGIDEKVKIKKIDHRVAKKLTLDPLTSTQLTSKDVVRLLEGMTLVEGDKVRATLTAAPCQDFIVLKASPEGALIIDANITRVTLKRKETREPSKVTYEDIGGLDQEIQKIREMIELPLKFPQVFERLGIEPPKGVLLYGPPGTGKTLLARAIANESGCNFYSVSGPEIFHKYVGQSAEHLRAIFQQAQANPPAILFVDEIDAMAPKRENLDVGGAASEQYKGVVNQLAALLDGLEGRGKIIIIGATNLPDSLDPAMRRPGRFDREIAIGIPNAKGRLEILEIHTRGMPLARDMHLEKLAEITHGFVGADLEALCREAAMKCLRTIIPDIDFELEEIPYDKLMTLEVTRGHFMQARNEIEPSALREVLIEIPDVSWEEVGGLDEIKQVLNETIEWPLKYPKVFEHAKTPPPKGILLYGPPGTGKTLVAKAVAKESGVNFISIKGPALMSRWVGESEKGVREHFKKARQGAPCIIFFDEIDAIAPRRSGADTTHVSERTISQLLTELDGIEPLRGVVALFATNRRDIIDEALLRPGRIDREFEFPIPDKAVRIKIFEIHTKGKPLTEDINLEKLADLTKGKTGADIASLCQTAAMLAIREFIQTAEEDKKDKPDFYIQVRHFEEALGIESSEGKPQKDDFLEKVEEVEEAGVKKIEKELKDI